MIRILFRTVGYLLLAAAFVAAVVDGTRSIAASGWQITSLQGFLERVQPSALPALKTMATQVNAVLWDPVAVTALKVPLAALFLVLGLVLALLSSPREPEVGIVARR
ncbi:hypothetical protein [uncultured Alsobacter sp.]|uniref:hypothetical protein n=1 Tax=uncultured Alsobacter sp. TaxID=1748258 RepID=UPI0025E536AB|nr:hypothetical protein [uncultured Alsobacter sp.]